MIRNAGKPDRATIAAIAEATGMFISEELDFFMADVNGFLDGSTNGALLRVAVDKSDAPVGATYIMPEMMAQGVHNLLFIGVLPDARRGGHGARLMADFELAALAADARLAIIETASDAIFAPAWALYKRSGYDEEARVRDFYDTGLDKLVFRKQLQ